MCTINEKEPLELETDASDIALSAVLNQNGRPVGFFSRTLHGSELKHSAIEKEAAAIVEAVKHWRHFLSGRHFKLITDQKSVSCIFNQKHHSRIKSDKFLRWRLELSCFSFDIVYRPGEENLVADGLSRATCSAINSNNLYDLHSSLCHPGFTRLVFLIMIKHD